MSAEDDARDAARWRYTQQPGYFYLTGVTTYGEDLGYKSVGVLKYDPHPRHTDYPPVQRSITRCIEGRGATVQDAIDDALSKAARGEAR